MATATGRAPYVPGKTPQVSDADAVELAYYLERELHSIAFTLQQDVTLNVDNVAPTKVQQGLFVYADGTNWNPGHGEGLYLYTSAGGYSLVGGTPAGVYLAITNNLSDLNNVITARSNLGLTAAATMLLPVSVANGGTGQSSSTGSGAVVLQSGPLITGSPNTRGLHVSDSNGNNTAFTGSSTSNASIIFYDNGGSNFNAEGVLSDGSRISANPTDWYWRNTSAADRMHLVGSTGNLFIAGTYNTSDGTLKKNVQTLQASSLIDQLRPVSFNWIDPEQDQRMQFGFIAQEVQALLPNVVEVGLNGKLALNICAAIPLLVAEIQALRKRVATLEAKVP